MWTGINNSNCFHAVLIYFFMKKLFSEHEVSLQLAWQMGKGRTDRVWLSDNGQELCPACLIWVVHSVPERGWVQRALGGPIRFVRKVICGAQSQPLLLWALLWKYRWKSHHADDVITPATPVTEMTPESLLWPIFVCLWAQLSVSCWEVGVSGGGNPVQGEDIPNI